MFSCEESEQFKPFAIFFFITEWKKCFNVAGFEVFNMHVYFILLTI